MVFISEMVFISDKGLKIYVRTHTCIYVHLYHREIDEESINNDW